MPKKQASNVTSKAKKSAANEPEETKKNPRGQRKSKAAQEEEDKTGDHPLPKRPISSYLRFNGEFCKKFVQDGGEHKDGMAAAGKRWGEMSDEDKKPYVEAAAAAKKIFEKQLAELKKQGFYLLEDGSKSTDPQNAHLSQPDRTGTHPPPKRPASAWLYFNTDTVKELVGSGVARTEAFKQSAAKW